MSDAVSRFLEPGEEASIELAPSGFPPVGWAVAILYVASVLALLTEIAGGRILILDTGTRRLDVPIVVPGMIALAAIELYRIARFRSWLYVVTPRRVLALRGVLWTSVAWSHALEKVGGVTLAHGDPELVTRGGGLVLTGVGAACLPALRSALPSMKHGASLPEPTTKPRSRRREVVFLVGLVCLVALVQARTWAWNRAAVQASAFGSGLTSAVSAATAATTQDIERPGGGPQTHLVSSRPGLATNLISGDYDVLLESTALAPGQSVRTTRSGVVTEIRVVGEGKSHPEGTRVSVHVQCAWSVGWLYTPPEAVEVLEREATDNALFMEHLRRECEPLGVPVRVKR